MFRQIGRFIKGEYPIPFILYKLHTKKSVIGKRFPRKMYRFFSTEKYNKLNDYSIINLETYDGLDQVTHPSVVEYNNNYILAVTPFPYGNDRYENPCLYISNDGETFNRISNAQPLVYPRTHAGLVYLSDPFLYVRDNRLRLLYRECIYSDDKNYDAFIYEMHTNDLVNWSTPCEIMRCARGAMSPTVLNDGAIDFLYYVEFFGDGTRLLKRRIEDGAECEIRVDGIPSGMMLWHIDFLSYRTESYGLFTLSINHSGAGARTFWAAKRSDGSWILCNEIKLADDSVITKTYKSCAIPQQDEVLLYVSVRRKDRKWQVYSKKLKPEQEIYRTDK